MHDKISHMLRNVIITNNKVNLSKLSKAPPPTPTPFTRAFGSLFCVGARYLYLISFSHRPGIVFPLAFVLPDVNTFYQYAAQYLLNNYMVQFVD